MYHFSLILRAKEKNAEKSKLQVEQDVRCPQEGGKATSISL